MPQVRRAGNMLHDLSLESPGKFLIGGEILGGLGNFFVKAAVTGMPFCVLFWSHRKDKDIYNRLFICEDFTMHPVACGHAHFFQLHYPYTSENGPVVLYGSVVGAWL